jgi:isovaleryl-CoA dehydrogenase
MAYKIDRDDHLDIKQLWPMMGEIGVLGVSCPTAYGGLGLGYLDHALMSEELGRASGGVTSGYVAHSYLCMHPIIEYATESLKKKYLPKLCSGEFVGAFGASESEAGSDLLSMKLRATKTQGGYVLNGKKMWITNGPDADVLVVYAKTEPELGAKGITGFLIEKDYRGFKPSPKLDLLGNRGIKLSELVFEDCFVPESQVIGKVNGGGIALLKGTGPERILLAAYSLGLTQATLDCVVQYRKQSGQALSESQLIQGKLADMFTALESSRSFVYSTAIKADLELGTAKDYAAVYLLASANALKVALKGSQILGNNGYTNDYPVDRILRDSKALEIVAGTHEIRRMIIGRELGKD